MNNNIEALRCPECKCKFAVADVKERALRCPECGHVIFEYIKEGEQLNAPQFMALLNSRGIEAARKMAAWLPGGDSRLNRIRAGIMIPGIWTTLASSIFNEGKGNGHSTELS